MMRLKVNYELWATTTWWNGQRSNGFIMTTLAVFGWEDWYTYPHIHIHLAPSDYHFGVCKTLLTVKKEIGRPKRHWKSLRKVYQQWTAEILHWWNCEHNFMAWKIMNNNSFSTNFFFFVSKCTKNLADFLNHPILNNFYFGETYLREVVVVLSLVITTKVIPQQHWNPFLIKTT